MSKFEKLSQLIADHEMFWGALGSKHTAGEWPELAWFLHDKWDPFFTKWGDWEAKLRSGTAHLRRPDMFVEEVANALSHVRADAAHEYGIPVPDIGSSGPKTYAGAVDIMGSWQTDVLSQLRKKAQGVSSDHRKNPSGWSSHPGRTRHSAPQTAHQKFGPSPMALALQAQEKQRAPMQRAQQAQQASQDYDDGDDCDDYDDTSDVTSGWFSDAVNSVGDAAKSAYHNIAKHVTKKDLEEGASWGAAAVATVYGGPAAGATAKKLADAGFKALDGDPHAQAALAEAASGAAGIDPKLVKIAVDAVNSSGTTAKVAAATVDAKKGNVKAKVALAKVSIAAQDPNAHPDVQFAAGVAEHMASVVKAKGNDPIALMASWA